jgi:cytochrome c
MRFLRMPIGIRRVIRGLVTLTAATAVVAVYWGSVAVGAMEPAADPQPGTAAVASASESGPATVADAGNARRGRLLYLQCRSCHSVEKGGMNKVGPNLYGVFGRAAGQVEDFVYSEALLESGIVWSPETLDAWLADPSEFVPGNRMIFTGIADPQDRADLIAYVREATASEE